MLQPILSNLGGKRIVLASGSPRRKDILARIGLTFEVIPSTFEENLDKSLFTPEEYVQETAKGKALEVAERLKGPSMPDLIIGADTVVALGNKILEKPQSEKGAIEMLTELSGSTHKVHTGMILIKQCDGELTTVKFFETTEVMFAELTPDIVRGYVATGEPMDKAGGYGIQAIGGTLVKGIMGDYFNVMGFPLHHFCCKMLELFGKS
ncbi:probable bifunctional dTTP/UTP pyrophosphatase/methyltransferase protein [Lytechinus variegatus]|uniref:probable bifunctional dTTP/UTP pyrophosphatase/methyltransferase protein n=1 Tax=Lytechinus variegatus TaxID=7654 RepID=UPI001BB1A088|nr:probable bifunctional dTTP/UTP pyrophosphatase/methyltransferase protein [Lytechinus variegatus]